MGELVEGDDTVVHDADVLAVRLFADHSVGAQFLEAAEATRLDEYLVDDGEQPEVPPRRAVVAEFRDEELAARIGDACVLGEGECGGRGHFSFNCTGRGEGLQR